MEDKEDIDELLKQLNPDNIPVNPANNNMPQRKSIFVKEEIDIDEESVGQFVMQNAAQIVKSGVDAIEYLKSEMLTAIDADEIAALSEIMRATTSAVDSLNKINIQNKKIKAAKELKQMDIDNKLSLPKGPGNINILVATREEIMEKITRGEDISTVQANDIEADYSDLE